MHTVAYAGDESSGSELTYCNEVGQNPPYDECIVFKSSFHSPREGGGAWNPDFEYECRQLSQPHYNKRVFGS